MDRIKNWIKTWFKSSKKKESIEITFYSNSLSKKQQRAKWRQDFQNDYFRWTQVSLSDIEYAGLLEKFRLNDPAIVKDLNMQDKNEDLYDFRIGNFILTVAAEVKDKRLTRVIAIREELEKPKHVEAPLRLCPADKRARNKELPKSKDKKVIPKSPKQKTKRKVIKTIEDEEHKENIRRHFHKRLHERLHIHISDKEYYQWTELVEERRNGKLNGVLVAGDASRASLFDIRYAKRFIRVVYDRDLKMLVTCYPSGKQV